MAFCRAAVLLASLFLPAASLAGDFDPLISRLAADGIDRGELEAVFSRPEVRYDQKAMGTKLMEIYMAKYGSDLLRGIQARLIELEYYFGPADGRMHYLVKMGIKAFQELHGLTPDGKPSLELLARARAETAKAPASLGLKNLKAPPVTVYEVILTPERLGEAKDFYRANLPLLRATEARYGIPAEIMVGLLTVETRVGKFLGEDLAVNNLASMAVCDSYAKAAASFPGERVTPDREAWLSARAAEKSAWAYRELKALLAHAKAHQADLCIMPGSIYGAVGLCQFMPSNIARYGVDGDGDGRIDLFVLADALPSLANYLVAHGFKPGPNPESQRKALFRYNHSKVYVNTIMAVAGYLRGQPLP